MAMPSIYKLEIDCRGDEQGTEEVTIRLTNQFTLNEPDVNRLPGFRNALLAWLKTAT